jgi:hypothetical protein
MYPAVDANGRTEVYAQRFRSGGLRKQLSPEGGYDPVWRGDGKEILYLNGSTVYSLMVEEQGDTLRAKAPVALFQVRVPNGMVVGDTPLAVTRDGSKILFAQGSEQPNPQLTYVMTAWDMLLHQGTGSADLNPAQHLPQPDREIHLHPDCLPFPHQVTQRGNLAEAQVRSQQSPHRPNSR